MFIYAPGDVIVRVGDAEGGEPGRDHDDEDGGDDGAKVAHREQQQEDAQNVELHVVRHVPAPQHALYSEN